MTLLLFKTTPIQSQLHIQPLECPPSLLDATPILGNLTSSIGNYTYHRWSYTYCEFGRTCLGRIYNCYETRPAERRAVNTLLQLDTPDSSRETVVESFIELASSRFTHQSR